MIWISVKETAELLNITERAIRYSIENNRVTYRIISGKGGNKGKIYTILLNSLSQHAQDKYNNISREQKDLTCFTNKQRIEAGKKAEAVISWLRAKSEKINKETFIEQFNESHPSFQITKTQLTRWTAKYSINNDVADLIDTRGGLNKGECSIPDYIWNYFYYMYMKESRLGVQICYDETKRIYSDIPDISTFRRKIKQIPEYAIQYYRYGKTAAKDALPYMERDYTDINTNDIWFSDHHELDYFIRDKRNKPVRPWLTVWFDARSRTLTSWKIRTEYPNANVIKETLCSGMAEHGKPLEVYVDNGKDYKAKENLDKENPYSLINILNINSIFATPYHGQAKTVERFFRTLEERHGKRQITYAGRNAKERPESLKHVPIELYPTLEEAIKGFENWLNDDYHSRAHRGDGMERKTPNQVYSENLTEIREVDAELLKILSGRTEERVINKNGISMFDNSYWNDKFIYMKGQKVKVIYYPENIEEISVFDENMKGICKAQIKVKTPFRHTTAEDYKAAKRKQKIAKKLIKEQKPILNMDTWQQISQNQAIERAEQFEIPSDVIRINESLELFDNIKILNNFNNTQAEDNSIEISMFEILEKMGG